MPVLFIPIFSIIVHRKIKQEQFPHCKVAATSLFLCLILIQWIVCWREGSHGRFSLTNQTNISKRGIFGESIGEHTCTLTFFAHYSPSLWTPSLHLCCRLAFDQRSQTRSGGIDRRERRERGDRMRCGGERDSLGLQSSKRDLGYIP